MREFLMLAKTLDMKKHNILGWYASEKMDGMRCLWDGRITEGLYVDQVPWANVEKDARLVSRPKCTGLWSRYGKVIHCPPEFTTGLPSGVPLDGELFIDRGCFQQLVSIVKKHDPNRHDWKDIRFCVFEAPCYSQLFANGKINGANFKKEFEGIWYKDNHRVFNYGQTVVYLNGLGLGIETTPIRSHNQLEEIMNTVLVSGGEGIMIRNPYSFWEPRRSSFLLKYKPFQDAEAVVIGYKWGRKTDKGSKLLGMLGSLIVKWNMKEFELSGFTDLERTIVKVNNSKYCSDPFPEGCIHQGETVNNNYSSLHFPRGSIITFRYRTITDDGVPKEARFLRKFQN